MPLIRGINIPKESNIQNYIINGNFDFWQRGITSTITTNVTDRIADRMGYNFNLAASKNITISRSTDIPTFAQSGFNSVYSYLVTNTTAIASLSTTEAYQPASYRMEGVDLVNIHKKPITVSFWFKASIAGTYSFSVRNNASDRSYVTTFSVSSANTWEKKTINITMDQSGTWLLDTGIGAFIDIGCLTGSTYQTSTLGSWQSGIFLTASTSTNWIATAGATIQVSQFQINEGPVVAPFSLYGKTIDEEIIACQRYYEVNTVHSCMVTSVAGDGVSNSIEFKTNKRANPTVTVIGNWYTAGGSVTALPNNNDRISTLSFRTIMIGASTAVYADFEYRANAEL